MISSKKSILGTLCLAAVVVTTVAHAAEKDIGDLVKHSGTVEYGLHPGTTADAIVVMEADEDLPLHHASKEVRVIRGKIHSNERDRVMDGTVTHAPYTIVSPLRKGEPVKLFLKRYKDRNDFYIIGVLPAESPSGVKQ